MVSAAHVLGAIAKNVIDKAPMKIMSGHLDLGFNVPITPCQRNCPIRQDIATYIDYVSQGRYVELVGGDPRDQSLPEHARHGSATTRARPTASAAGIPARSR